VRLGSLFLSSLPLPRFVIFNQVSLQGIIKLMKKPSYSHSLVFFIEDMAAITMKLKQTTESV